MLFSNVRISEDLFMVCKDFRCMSCIEFDITSDRIVEKKWETWISMLKEKSLNKQISCKNNHRQHGYYE